MKQNHMLNIRFDVVLGVNRHYMLRFFFPPLVGDSTSPATFREGGTLGKAQRVLFFPGTEI